MKKTKFIGSYLEPGEVAEQDTQQLFDWYQHDGQIRNFFFRVYEFRVERDDPNHPYAGGAYCTLHPEYYEGTFLRDFQAKEGDLLAKVVAEAGKRDLGVYLYFFPAKCPPGLVPGFERVLERDTLGNPGAHACWRHPEYRQHLIAAARDMLTSYPVLGMMWGAERCGPFGWMVLKASKGAQPTCFCEHCCAAGAAKGIEVERAREGWRKLSEMYAGVRASGPPVEGAFINLWRLLLRYPEILSWEMLWWEGKQSIQREIYSLCKSLRGGLTMGYHTWHRGRAFSPFNRAAYDYEEMCEYADFIKPAVFSNPAGFRIKEQVDGLRTTVLADLGDAEATQLLFHLLRYDRECEYDELTAHPISPRYVYREVEMARKVVNGRIPIYAGIAAGTYTGYPGIRECTADDVAGDLRAADQAGAEGVIFTAHVPRLAKAMGDALKREGWA